MIHTVQRLSAAAVVVFVAGALLSACTGNSTQATSDWLQGREGVLEVTQSGAHADQSYSGIARVELDPKASNSVITTLIRDTVKQVAKNGDEGVAVQFGEGGVAAPIDFEVYGTEVTSADEALAALSLWHDVTKVKHLLSALVSDERISVRTLRADGIETYQALDLLPASIDVATYLSTEELPENTPGTLDPAVHIMAAELCTATQPVIDVADATLADTEVSFGTLDLCTGFDITYPEGTRLTDHAVLERRALDVAQLGNLPITLTAPAADSPDGTDVHRVAISPGAASALSVLPYLEVGGAPVFSWELDAERHLTLTSISTGTPIADVLVLLRSSAAAHQLPLVTASDDRIGATGTYDALPPLLSAASTLVDASAQLQSVELAAASGVITLTDTGDLADAPDFTEGATALRASGLCTTRDLTISYQGVQAHIVNGAVQDFDASGLSNFDETLQAFLDAFTAAP